MTNERVIQILESLISIDGDVIIVGEYKEALEIAIRSLQQEQEKEMTDAEIIANIFGCPCNFSPIDEEMGATGECEDVCGSDEQTDVKCWQRYFDLKRKEEKK